MTPKSERFELRLDPEILERIDNWRSERADLPSRSESVRRLIEAGLGHPEDEQLFEIARFNVLVAAKTEGPSEALSGAYVYAWDNGVYPVFHEGAHLHRPFAANFQVTKEMIAELLKYLDAQWLAKKIPTFYALEDYYDVRSGRSPWERTSLIRACRYMFLSDLFDRSFWAALLKGSDHPTEAKSVAEKFETSDLYLT